MEDNIKEITIRKIEKIEKSIHLVKNHLEVLKYQDLRQKLYSDLGEFYESDKISKNIIAKATDYATSGNYRAQCIDILKHCYFSRAKRHFEDYMIAVEWDRTANARFYLPRQAVLEGQHKIISTFNEFMEDEDSYYLGLSTPPGAGKSTIIKFLLAFIAGKYHLSANMYISYSDGMVKMMYDGVCDIINADEYCHNEIFGLGSPIISGEYRTISYRSKGDFPTVGLGSLGGSITGRTRANRFLVSDDLVRNAEMARSPERLDKLWEDYRSTVTSRAIGDFVKIIQLGTRWSIHDPLNRTEIKHKDNPKYKFIKIPVWDDNEISNFDYCKHNGGILVDGYSEKQIAIVKENISNTDFMSLYMQESIEKQGIAFAADTLRWYNGILPDGPARRIFFALDPAFGSHDFLAFGIFYDYGDDGVYLHDVLFIVAETKITKPLMVAKVVEHQCTSGIAEANNGGDFLIENVQDILRQKHSYTLNVKTQKAPTNISKEARIEQYAPEMRNFYYRNDKSVSDDYKTFIKWFTRFSFTAKNEYDDANDMVAMAASYLNKRGSLVVTRINRGDSRL